MRARGGGCGKPPGQTNTLVGVDRERDVQWEGGICRHIDHHLPLQLAVVPGCNPTHLYCSLRLCPHTATIYKSGRPDEHTRVLLFTLHA